MSLVRNRSLAVAAAAAMACTWLLPTAHAAPPEPSTITAPVRKGAIRSTLPVDALIQRSSTVEVQPVAPADGSLAIVTGIHVNVGKPVESGQALVEVAGRPTFVLPGSLPAYRTMGAGRAGADVAQLQDGLRALGYEVDDGEALFGPSTKSAVAKFYADRGFEPLLSGEDEVDAAHDQRAS